ncbi:MAG: TolC family protein [bacterium]|nr:TolC family protein [bacterium]
MIRSLALLTLVSILAGTTPAHAISDEEVIGSDRLITLQEAIELALRNNLDLQVSRTDPALARLGIKESKGAFDPKFVGGASFGHSEQPVASNLQSAFGSGSSIDEDTWTYNGGLQGQLPWGLTYGSMYALNRLETTSGFNALDPEWRAQWKTEITIPLLRGFYWSASDLAVRRSYVLNDVSNQDFRALLNQTVFQVEAAYWDLTAARESETVAEKSLKTARAVLEQTQVQYEVGVVSKVSVAQAEAGVAQREFDAIVARNAATRGQDTLLDLILAPDFREFTVTTVRTEEPTFVVYQVDAEAAIQRAFERRPEIAAARKRVEDADLQLKYARNQRLPALDTSASYSMDGLSGDPKPSATSSLGISEGSHSANDKFFRHDGAHSWSVGASIEIPFGNDVADSRYSMSKIMFRRAKTQLRQSEQTVTIDVRVAVRELRNAIDAVKAAERNVAARSESLRAEQERLRLGDSTPRNVLEVEEDLAAAEQQEIAALQRYAVAISALERAQSSLLESRGIKVEEELRRMP